MNVEASDEEGTSKCKDMAGFAEAISVANRQARASEMEKAIAGFRQAPDTGMELSPDEEAKHVARTSLVFEARKLARIGEIDRAEELLLQARAFGVQLSRADVLRLSALQLVAEGRSLAKSGDATGARTRFSQASERDPTLQLEALRPYAGK